MATPTLRAIRQHYGPSATITGIQRPYVSEVLAGTNWLTDSIEFNPKPKSLSERRGTLNLARELRSREFDSAIILPNSPRTAFAAWLAKIPQRVGYVRYLRGPMLTEKIHPPRDGKRLRPISALDYYLGLATAIGAETSNRNIELRSTANRDADVDRIWAERNLNGRRVVAFNTGGAYGAAKTWPAEHFADLAKRLVRDENTSVVIVSGPSERESSDLIQKKSASRDVHSLSDQVASIGLTKAIIKRSQMLITTDSGPRFFGTAFSVPTITVFGSTDPRWSSTGHPLEHNVNIDVDCGPCAKRVCPLKHHKCMRDLTPESVFLRAQNVFATIGRDAA